jgi:hypothetical protein
MSGIPDLSLRFGLARSEFKRLHREQIEFLESRIERLNNADRDEDRKPVLAELAARLKQEADDLQKLHPDPQFSGGRRAFIKALGIAVSPPLDDPTIVRGPHGVTFKYTNPPETAGQQPEDFDPAKHPEWVARVEENLRNESRMEEARRVDPMPDPETITVGEMIDFLTFIARTPHDRLAVPEIGQMYLRRNMVLSASPGWKAFEHWRDIEHHRKRPPEAANELLALLVERLRKPSRELRLMPLLDAVRLIDQPEAAGIVAPRNDKDDRPSEVMWVLDRDIRQSSAVRPLLTPPAAASSDETPAIDYDALAAKLAAQGKGNQAALVRFMKDKDFAQVEDIADVVHGDAQVSEKAISKNARCTNESLVALKSPLSFRVAGGMMHKKISPE